MDRREFIGQIITGSLVATSSENIQIDQASRQKEVKGVLVQRLDVFNRNRHLYTTEAMREAVQKAQDSIKSRSFMGHLGMESSTVTFFDKVSHLVTDLWIEDKCLLANIEFLDTPLGIVLSKIPPQQIAYRFCCMTTSNQPQQDGSIIIDKGMTICHINAIQAHDAA